MNCVLQDSNIQSNHCLQSKTGIFESSNEHRYLKCLSQSTDENVKQSQTDYNNGSWATGRVTWNPSIGLTGVQPVVDRYSITKYSLKDWRKKNEEILATIAAPTQLKDNVKSTINTISAGADQRQKENTALLESRAKEVLDCKNEMEFIIKAFREEIVLLTETKIRLKYAMPALKMPESIAGECIDRRTSRIEPELVKDEVEIELIKELSLINDIADTYSEAIKEIEKQILANRSCKDQVEIAWSDKKETFEIESLNVCLKNDTPIIGHHGGAVRFPENQSTIDSWVIFNATLINTAKDELTKSETLRKTVQMKIIEDSVHSLQIQANKVLKALLKRIEETDQCRQMFEVELQSVLKQIAEAESFYEGLIKLQRQLDYNLKVVETRLENRMSRPRVENCRDPAEYGLLEEVKYLTESKSSLKKQIDDIDKVVSNLYESRSNLEFVILTKKKSLYVDQQRCLAYREKYPDSITLYGNI